MNYYGSIYKIINLINSKIYIGQTKSNPPIKRFRSHIYYAKKNSSMLISRAINKYGKENFKFELICTCFNQEELNKQEEYFIKLYDSTNNKNGYNLNNIVDGRWKHNCETKNNLSKLRKTEKYIKISSESGKKTRNSKKIWASSIYIGVSKSGNKWKSSCRLNNKNYNLGVFNNEKDAAKAKDIFEVKNFGKKAVLNFPELLDKYLKNEIIVKPNKIHQEIQSNKKSNSNIVGVWYSNAKKRWLFDRKGFKFKSFREKEDCEKHAIEQYKERGIDTSYF